MSKRAAIYTRVSTLEQNPQSQLYDLQTLARQRGLEVVKVYTDHGISGARTRRPALDELLRDARRGEFDIVLVWACDRLARSVKHFLEVLDELGHLNIQFLSYRETLDTTGALGKAVVTIISVVAELERSLIIERVRAGMRRAKLEGKHCGRRPLTVDRSAVLRERANGRSLAQLASTFRISRASVSRLLKAAQEGGHESPDWSP